MLLRSLFLGFLVLNAVKCASEPLREPRESRPALIRKRLISSNVEISKSKLTTDEKQKDSSNADPQPPVRAETDQVTPGPTTEGTTKKAFSISFSNAGCLIKGRTYFEGQYIPGEGTKCQSCYCLRGRSHCATLKCPEPGAGCKAIFDEDKCCPVRFDCDTSDNRINSRISEEVRFNADLSEQDPLSTDKKINQNFADPDILLNQVRKDRQKRIEESSTTVTEEPVETQTTTAIDEEKTGDGVSVPPTTDDVMKMFMEDKVTPSVDDIAPQEPSSLPQDEVEAKKSETEKSMDEKKEIIVLEDEAAILTESKSVASDIKAIPQEETTIAPDRSTAEESQPAEAVPSEEASQNDLTSPVEKSKKDDLSSVFSVDEPSPLSALQELLLAAKEAQSKREKTANEAPSPNEEKNALIPEEKPAVNEDYDEFLTDYNEPIIYEFPSYDINVGSSMFAGTADQGSSDHRPLGVGQVIPVDLHSDSETPFQPFERRPQPPRPTPTPPPTTISTTTQESVSFLDAFLNMFGSGQPRRPPKKPEANERLSPEVEPISSSFIPGPLRPPPRIPPIQLPGPLRPPPSTFPARPEIVLKDVADEEVKVLPEEIAEEELPELQEEEMKSGDVNELPVEKITLDTNLPPRRPPAFLRPGLFATRPSPLPTRERPSLSPKEETVPASIFPSLPSDPVIEDGFNAVRRKDQVQASLTVVDNTPEKQSEPTKDVSLPPSLPNLEIIPFVAADALVNKKAAAALNQEETRSPIIPIEVATPQENSQCREGGRVWQNGETVAKGSNPCLTCMCKTGKIVCENKECPREALPPGCRRFRPERGQCCPTVKCQRDHERPSVLAESVAEEKETATIVDELVSLATVEPTTIRSRPNLAPPRASELPRTPPRRPSFPSRRPPFLLPPERRTPNRPSRPVKNEDETTTTTTTESVPIRPQRPTPRPTQERPAERAPPLRRPEIPFFRPFADRNENRRRPDFIPPRNKFPSRTNNRVPVGIAIQRQPSNPPQPTKPKPSLPSLSELLTSEAPSPPPTVATTTPTTIASTTTKGTTPFVPVEPEVVHSKVQPIEEQPFGFPPGFVLPLPIPNSNPDIPDDIFENILQDPFETPSGKPIDDKTHSNVLFSLPKPVRPSFPKPTTEAPKIPEHIKNMFPLGNDPILSLGLFELDNCNVYGRIYQVGATIDAMSSECKECRCTPVGVQCLPVCPPNF